MPLTPIPVESFGGLNLLDDPGTVGWSGATDLLNVDFDQRGRIRSRDGYASFIASLAGRGTFVYPFYQSTGTKQLIVANSGTNKAQAYDTSGATVGLTGDLVDATSASMVRFAAPGSEHLYAAGFPVFAGSIIRWDGATWTTPTWTGTTPNGRHLAVEATDNRLVNARRSGSTAGDNVSTVRFSDAGAPTTWGANNYVDLHPGDGEEITRLVAWRDLVFAFKETKFFTFYGTSTDSSGNPVFNFRPFVTAGLEKAAYRATAVAPHGVYFFNRRGIWLTSGAEPTLISSAMDPIFRGQGASSFWQGGYLNQAQVGLCAMHWHDNRLYFAYPSGSSTYNDKMLVYTPSAETWTLLDIPCAALSSFRIGDTEELVFCYATGASSVGRLSSSYTTDAGTAITSRYRSGFSDLGSPDRKVAREWLLEGSGSPTFQTSHDFGSLETGAAVTLGTSPAIVENRRRFAVKGRQFSFQIGGTSAWSVNNVVANLRDKKLPGES